jgi:hypothetical protein
MAHYAVGGEPMKKQCWGRLASLVVIVLGLGACQSGQPGPRASTAPRPSASAVAVSPQRCEHLAKRGFTPCPPAPDRLALPPTTIRNATSGAVPDATAREWGHAFQLAQAYYYWAMQTNARGALTAGVLSDPSPQAVSNLFGTDLADLDNAKQQGGVLVYEPLKMPTTQLVAIPADLQQKMQIQGLVPRPYAFAVRFVGPASRTIRLSNGQTQPLRNSPADYEIVGLVWGEVKSDPDLGEIWFEYGAYGCDGEVRNVCQT